MFQTISILTNIFHFLILLSIYSRYVRVRIYFMIENTRISATRRGHIAMAIFILRPCPQRKFINSKN